MINYDNECVGCKDVGLPCHGDGCPNRHVKRLYCDDCGDKTDTLYIFSGAQLCKGCLLRIIPTITND